MTLEVDEILVSAPSERRRGWQLQRRRLLRLRRLGDRGERLGDRPVELGNCLGALGAVDGGAAVDLVIPGCGDPAVLQESREQRRPNIDGLALPFLQAEALVGAQIARL